MTWDEVELQARHGIIRGYKAFCEDPNGVVTTTNVEGGDSREVMITGLQFLTEYKVSVLAYTSVGDGPQSTQIAVTTDESSKNLF